MLDIKEIAGEDHDLPTPVAALLMQATLEEKPESECLEQRLMFLLSDLDDLLSIYKCPRTTQLFRDQEEHIWSALTRLHLIASDMKQGRVHDRPSPAQGSVRSPALRVVAGGV